MGDFSLMTSERIRVLIIGMGNIAMGYDFRLDNVTWTHVSAINKDDRFHLVAGIDPAIEKHRGFEVKTGAKAYGSVNEFMDKSTERIDLVVIASPTQYHIEYYLKIKAINPKLVLMEKPIGSKYDEIGPFIEEVKAGPKLMVNLFRLYQKSLNRALKKIALDKGCHIQVRYSQSIEHNAIHFMSLIIRHFGTCLSQSTIPILGTVARSYRFENAHAVFQPAIKGTDDNSMIIHFNEGALYYLNGGRIFFEVDASHIRTDYDCEQFNHHMSYVYGQCSSVIKGEMDDSFSLACKGHNLLVNSESKYEKSYSL